MLITIAKNDLKWLWEAKWKASRGAWVMRRSHLCCCAKQPRDTGRRSHATGALPLQLGNLGWSDLGTPERFAAPWSSILRPTPQIGALGIRIPTGAAHTYTTLAK
jgi:hypothetical protein